MSYLKDKLAYLCGPIEFESGVDWRPNVMNFLDSINCRSFNPAKDEKQSAVPKLNEARNNHDYETMAEIARKFVKKDLQIISRSDILIACLPYKCPTTGSVHEIVNSVAEKKLTLLVCPQGKNLVPAWFYGFINHKYMFGSFEDLFTYLKEVDDGKHMNDEKLNFIYGLI